MADDSLHDSEEWRPVPGYEGWYEVSSHGRVRRIVAGGGARVGRILRGVPSDESGRLVLNLSREGKSRSHLVHRLVCAAFHGPQPSPQHEVAHWDGNAAHNHEDNLRWATSAENKADMVRHGTTRSNLTAADVRQMRALRAAGWHYRAIAARFNLSLAGAHKIVIGKLWSHLGDPS